MTQPELPSAAKTVTLLKEDGEDYEWYPTTPEIITALWKDIVNHAGRHYRDDYSHGHSRGISYTPHHTGNTSLMIDTMLDIGTGDGRVMTPPKGIVDIEINNKVGVEKARRLADSLVSKGIWLLGRDYMTITLIDKKFDVVFSNPPYEQFKPWCAKLLREVDAQLIYLLIPVRWKVDDHLMTAMHNKGTVEVVGQFNFSEGDRVARGEVNLIRIVKENDKQNVFHDWIKENIGEFKADEREAAAKENIPEDAVAEGKDTGTALIDNYNDDMQKLLEVYRALDALDFNMLMQLGVEQTTVFNKIASDIETLKFQYWHKAFESMGVFRERLTYSTAEKMVTSMKEFQQLDFNADNIRNIILWVIKHFDHNSEQQLLKCYDDMTYFGSVHAYKSNEKWLNDGWRYNAMNDGKGMPEKHTLDYRIVASGSSLVRDNFADAPDWDEGYGWHHRDNNLVTDLCVVINSLGFTVPNRTITGITLGKQHSIEDEHGKELFAFRAYKNKNLHLKIRKDVLKAINIEVGKLKGWLREPADVVKEFDVSEKEAAACFQSSRLLKMDMSSVKLLA